MRLTREVKFGIWSVAAVVIAIVAFYAGGQLKPEEEPYFLFDVSAPAFGGDLESLAAMSPGGFTGFQDLIPGGSRTVLGGRIVELTDTTMTLETASGALTEMRLQGSPRLTRLEPAARELLVNGAEVIVKLGDAEGEATAVLVLSQP